MVEVYFVNEAIKGEPIPVQCEISKFLPRFPSEYTANNVIVISQSGSPLNLEDPIMGQAMDVTEIYVFRKDSMNRDLPIKQVDPREFRGFGLDEFYEESFNFERFESFPTSHQSVPDSEVRLFNIQMRAKQAYARFISKIDYLEQICPAYSIRISASRALVENVKLYNKTMRHKVTDIDCEFGQFELNARNTSDEFQRAISSLQQASLPPELRRLFSDSNYTSIGEKFSEALVSFRMKLINVKKAISAVSDTLETFTNATSTLQNNINNANHHFLEAKMRNHEMTFTQFMHEAVNLYNTFRDILNNKVLNAQATQRGASANALRDEMPPQIDAIEAKINGLDQIIENLMHSETDIQKTGKPIETKYRQTVKQWVQKTCELKYVIDAKLNRLRAEFDQLISDKASMVLPAQLIAASEAAKVEALRRNTVKESINQHYLRLSLSITQEEAAQELFLTQFGKVLPKDIHPDLVNTIQLSQHLRGSVDLAADSFVPNEAAAPEPMEIVNAYELKLQKQEKLHEKQLEVAQGTESKLQTDLTTLATKLAEVTSERDELYQDLKNYTMQLYLLKADSTQSSEIQTQIKSLSEREGLFMKKYNERVEELVAENERLRAEVANSSGSLNN